MHEIKIKRSDTIIKFESHQHNPLSRHKDLLIPNGLDYAGSIGTTMALAQFILTWSRTSKGGTINTFISWKNTEAIESFSSSIYGLAAAYFSGSLLSNDSTKVDIREETLKKAGDRITAMYSGNLKNTTKGQAIEFIFVQSAKQQFHSAIYRRAPTSSELTDRLAHGRLIRSEDELQKFIATCLISLELFKADAAKFKFVSATFGSLLAETFRNTAEHAYLTDEGTRYERNLRCIRLAITETGKTTLVEKTVSSQESANDARSYFAHISTSTNRETVKFLELSILDSGPGLAATIRKESNESLTDRDAVANCFEKHMTAKPDTNAGLGLFRSIQLVHNLQGFFRLRTSTVEAFYAGFSGFQPEMPPVNFIHGNLPRAEGTLITIGLPI